MKIPFAFILILSFSLLIPLKSKSADSTNTNKLGVGFTLQMGAGTGFEIKAAGYLKNDYIINVGFGIANLGVHYLKEYDTRLYIPHFSALLSSSKVWGFGKFDIGLPKTIHTTVPELQNGIYYSLSLGITNEFIGGYASVSSLKYWYFNNDTNKEEYKTHEILTVGILLKF